MRVDNPLTREFLLTYPTEAARVLEKVSAGDVAAFFNELPAVVSAQVVAVMLPDTAAACLSIMMPTAAARLMMELPLSSTGRIYRLLIPERQKELSGYVPDKLQHRIRRHLEYPHTSVGALLDPQIDILPESITVADAMRRIEHFDHAVAAEIYIINGLHQLVGVIDLGQLLIADPHARLRDIMNHKTQEISINAMTETLLSHPAWASSRRLPVIERDNTLAGALDFARLQESIAVGDTIATRDPLDNLLSLAGLYWLTVAQLLNSMLGKVDLRKRGGQE